ncbi:MAG TPA: TIGR00266 family protein [Rhodospirillaceae bacterium]|jgi:uncharacterized protein (TIGR00266 family)|nr:TIGR00266 family protein [Alphaproteobacteria bacterium]HBH26383.1 TIGR00266 family protein [Rhodospirillaceae bacterium]
MTKTDEVDYAIHGDDTQFVEIELDPGESAVAEAGAMIYMDQAIEMTTVFGDGSHQESQAGVWGALVGAGKRLLTGESLFTTVFTHKGSGKARVAFSAPYPGKIVPMDLARLGGTLICQRDAFLCGAKGVAIGIAFQQKIMTGLFGGEGFIMQKLEGDGLCFVHAGGAVVERRLEPGQSLAVDTGCVVAYDPGVHFDIRMVRGVKSAIFGGEGLFLAHLEGPGRVWLQSMPFARLAAQIAGRALANVGPSGGANNPLEGALNTLLSR